MVASHSFTLLSRMATECFICRTNAHLMVVRGMTAGHPRCKRRLLLLLATVSTRTTLPSQYQNGRCGNSQPSLSAYGPYLEERKLAQYGQDGTACPFEPMSWLPAIRNLGIARCSHYQVAVTTQLSWPTNSLAFHNCRRKNQADNSRPCSYSPT